MTALDLSTRVVAITGASRGLGAGLARVARAAGARLALCSRSAPVLPASDDVLAMQLDVTSAEAVDAFAAEAFRRFGHVDLWINNAGLVEPVGLLREADAAALHRLLDVNVLGVAHGCHAYARELAQRGASGIVINVSSGAGRKPYHGAAMYCATKAAVDRLSESLALEEAPRLTVYSAAPGVVDTDMQVVMRSRSPRDFPAVERFRQLHATGALLSPEQAAHNMLRFAFDPGSPRDQVCVDLR